MPNGAQPAFSPQQLDSIAKQRGYRNYDHMIYVAKNRLPKPKQDNGAAAGQRGQSGARNFLGKLWNDPASALADAFAWHPSRTIGRASDTLNTANQRNRK